MWTYRANEQQTSPKPVARPSEAAATSVFNEPKKMIIESGTAQSSTTKRPAVTEMKTQTPQLTRLQRKQRRGRRITGLGSLYLAGLLCGAVSNRYLSKQLMEYANYYANFTLQLHQQADKTLVLSTNFLAMFVQLTLFLLLGLCVLGCGLIPIGLFLKGTGTGLFLTFVYGQLGTVKGLFVQALIFWLPEVLSSLIIIALCACALQVSVGFLQVCCFGKATIALPQTIKRLVKRYLVLCLVSILPCGMSALLSFLFGGLF